MVAMGGFMKKTLTIVTAVALGSTLAACEPASAPVDANVAAENVVVDAADANVVDANVVDANAIDANAADNAVAAGNNTTVHGSTDH
jgi:hypothetical protein